MGGYDALSKGHVLLGKYRIEQKLGEGGMAVIYQASSLGAAGFSRPVVIKVIKPHLIREPGMKESFVREASVGAALDHPNIVHVFDLGEADGMLYMILEYVQGKDLAALIHSARKARRVLGPEMVAFLCVDVFKALECSHDHVDPQGIAKPIIHRDISPQNILLSRDGHVKLADFGMARALGTSRHTTEGVVKGKLSYMSPEQSRGVEVDARADLFSLGVVMWEALTGRRLFLRNSPIETIREVRACNIPPLAEVAQHVDPALGAIVHRLLQAAPEARFQTATEVRKALQSYLRTARPIDATALAGLLATYFPSKDPLSQTAVPELSFADEGEQSRVSETSPEIDEERIAEAEKQQGPAAAHTLVMFGAQAEALAKAFEQAQEAAQERGQKPNPHDNNAKTITLDGAGALPLVGSGLPDAPTVPHQLAISLDAPEQPTRAFDGVNTQRDDPARAATMQFSGNDAAPMANQAAPATPQNIKAPATIIVSRPPDVAAAIAAEQPSPPRGGNPAAQPPAATPYAQQYAAPSPRAFSAQQPQNAPIQATGQQMHQPFAAQATANPIQHSLAVPPSKTSRPFLISLIIGVPLGAVVGFLVFWLLTR